MAKMKATARMKPIIAVKDLESGRVLFEGESNECADYVGCTSIYLNKMLRNGNSFQKKYIFEKIGETPVMQPTTKKVKKLRERYSAIDAVWMRDVIKLRKKVYIGSRVRCFKDVESMYGRHQKVIIGIFPVSEKYRHLFVVDNGHYNESFTWVQLYRKDGVELVDG